MLKNKNKSTKLCFFILTCMALLGTAALAGDFPLPAGGVVIFRWGAGR